MIKKTGGGGDNKNIDAHIVENILKFNLKDVLVEWLKDKLGIDDEGYKWEKYVEKKLSDNDDIKNKKIKNLNNCDLSLVLQIILKNLDELSDRDIDKSNRIEKYIQYIRVTRNEYAHRANIDSVTDKDIFLDLAYIWGILDFLKIGNDLKTEINETINIGNKISITKNNDILSNVMKAIDFFQQEVCIPIYQRNYDWKKEQCSRLFEDIVELIKDSRKEHFLGTIFYNNENGRHYLIDGQQRVVSIYLLLTALCTIINEKISNNNATSNCINIRNKIETIILDPNNNTKLKLRFSYQKLQESLRKIVNIDTYSFADNNNTICNNFSFFKQEIETKLKTDNSFIGEIMNAIERLVIVSIEIKPNESLNVQRIFESLNSLGLDLKETDLIRNYLLMGLSDKKQQEYCDYYWNEIEENAKDEIVSFFRHFLIYELKETQIDNNKIYESFKKYIQKEQQKDSFDIEKIFKEILYFSKLYKKMISYSFNDQENEINNYIRNIIDSNFLDYTVIIPFIFCIYIRYDKKHRYEDIDYEVDFNELIKILKLLETSLFRYKISGGKSAHLKGIFNSLIRNLDTVKYDNPNYTLYDILLYCLTQNNSFYFQDDYMEEQIKFYKFSAPVGKSLLKNYIYQKIEKEYFTKNGVYINFYENNNITIEHILPLKYNDSNWPMEEQEKKDIKDYINTIGNLILVCDNSELSNSSFKSKLNTYNNSYGDKKIGIMQDFLNENHNRWNLRTIKERTNKLINIIKDIWRLPKSEIQLINYKEQNKHKQQQDVILTEMDNDDIREEITGLKEPLRYEIKSLNIISKEYKKFSDMFINIILDLYKTDKEKFINCYKTNELVKSFITDDSDKINDRDWSKGLLYYDNFYINSHASSAELSIRLKRLIIELDIGKDLKIFFFYKNDYCNKIASSFFD